MLYRFLKKSGKPFVGADATGARIAANKIVFKKYCDRHGIRTARWKIVKRASDISRFGFPCVLKAASGGSSREVAPLFSKNDLKSTHVRKILSLKDAFYVEDFVNGVEVTVGVLHGKALPVVEIVKPKKGWFDYRNKYSGKIKETPFAPSLSKKEQRTVQRIASRIHTNLKQGPYSRTDFIMKDGKPFILEMNTPNGVGMTPRSVFPLAAKAGGWSYRQMVEKMLGSSA